MKNVNKKLFVRKNVFVNVSKQINRSEEEKMNYGLGGNSKFISISHSFFHFFGKSVSSFLRYYFFREVPENLVVKSKETP